MNHWGPLAFGLVQWHADTGDMPGSPSRRGERSVGSHGVGSALGEVRAPPRILVMSGRQRMEEKELSGAVGANMKEQSGDLEETYCRNPGDFGGGGKDNGNSRRS